MVKVSGWPVSFGPARGHDPLEMPSDPLIHVKVKTWEGGLLLFTLFISSGSSGSENKGGRNMLRPVGQTWIGKWIGRGSTWIGAAWDRISRPAVLISEVS